MSKTDLHKAGRGSYDSKVNANTRAVHVSATQAGVHPLKTVKRGDKTAQKFVKVQCPAAVPSTMLTWQALTCMPCSLHWVASTTRASSGIAGSFTGN